MNARPFPIRHAVLLAAGLGTRVGATTATTPKCLLTVDGRVLLDRQLDALADAGVDEVTVVAGFMAERVLRHVADRCRVLVNERYATTNSIVSLHVAAPHLRGRAFLLQNADVLYPVALIRRLLDAPCENACLVDASRPYEDGEYHVETAEGRITRYSKAVPRERSIGVSAQLLRVGADDSAAFLDRIGDIVASGGSGGFPNQAYDVLMNGRGLAAVFTAGQPWWEIDTAADLARCDADHAVASGRVPGPTLQSSLRAFARSPEAPARVRRGLHKVAVLLVRPIRLVRAVRELRGRRLSLGALDLAVYGPTALAVALAEARAQGLEPFLLWGTLLGCVRDGGFIRGDTDIDLGLMEADQALLPVYRDRMRALGFEVRIDDGDKLSFFHPRHPRLFIDVDVVKPHRDGWVVTNRSASSTRCFRYHFPAPVFPRTRPAPFAHGLTVRIPEDADGFLRCAYGDWRMPAPKSDFRYGPLNTEVELLATPSRP